MTLRYSIRPAGKRGDLCYNRATPSTEPTYKEVDEEPRFLIRTMEGIGGPG
jgi:hypothetical protein